MFVVKPRSISKIRRMLLMAAFGGSVLGVLPQVALALDGTPTVERDPSLEIARQGLVLFLSRLFPAGSEQTNKNPFACFASGLL